MAVLCHQHWPWHVTAFGCAGEPLGTPRPVLDTMGCRDRESPRRHWGFLGPGSIPQIFSGLSLGSERQMLCSSHKPPLHPASPWCITGCWLAPMGAPWGAALL